MDGMDLLQGVQDAGAEAAMPDLPPDMGDFKMPTMEQMMDLLSKMDIPDDEKEKIMDGFTNKADIMDKLAGQGANRISAAMTQNRDFFDPMSSTGFFAILWLVMISVFAFFGYKLYKSLTDKERKREEKRKLKQMKKKK